MNITLPNYTIRKAMKDLRCLYCDGTKWATDPTFGKGRVYELTCENCGSFATLKEENVCPVCASTKTKNPKHTAWMDTVDCVDCGNRYRHGFNGRAVVVFRLNLSAKAIMDEFLGGVL